MGCVSAKRYEKYLKRKKDIEAAVALLKATKLSSADWRRLQTVAASEEGLSDCRVGLEEERPHFAGSVECVQDGRLEGVQDGRLEGVQDGRVEGVQDGRVEGVQDGRVEGVQEGWVGGGARYTAFDIFSIGHANPLRAIGYKPALQPMLENADIAHAVTALSILQILS